MYFDTERKINFLAFPSQGATQVLSVLKVLNLKGILKIRLIFFGAAAPIWALAYLHETLTSVF
jgi:hypothetical protein